MARTSCGMPSPEAEEIGVKLQPARGAKIAQFFQPRAVGGGVQFRGHDDHGFLGQFFAERGQLAR